MAAEEKEEVLEGQHKAIPMWLLFVYITLLTWSVWNLVKYWE